MATDLKGLTRMRSRSFLLGSVALVALVGIAAPARADEPSSADMSSARALGQEGVKLADAGNCAEAVDRLQRSERIFHAPTTLARLGECQVQLGKVVEGSENLNRVAREQLSASAPAAFVQAQERAKKVLAEAKPRIARLKIAVAAPPEAPLAVKVDGEPMPVANLNSNRPVDPGEHTVEASAPGYRTARAKVTLAEGGADTIALTLEVDPDAPKPVAGKADGAEKTVATTVTTQPPSTASSTGPSRTPAYVALGVGAAGLAVGAIFGGLALGKKGDLDDACPAGTCAPGQQGTIDDGKTFGVVSTVGFIVGGVAVAAGVYLWLRSSPRSATASSRAGERGPILGLDRIGLRF